MAGPSQPPGFLLTTLEKGMNWARTRSMWPASFGLACCAIEMMGTGASHNDLGRFGMEVFRASPRQADLMIVAARDEGCLRDSVRVSSDVADGYDSLVVMSLLDREYEARLAMGLEDGA